MYSTVTSAALLGIEACPVIVEADVSDGMPCFSMVGYLAGEVREAQDRVRTAIRSIGAGLPVKRITVNLSPADMRKEGAGFDLPIAAAVLEAAGYLPAGSAKGMLLVGELGLNGNLYPVRGVLQITACAKRLGCTACIVPSANLAEGSVMEGIRVYGAASLEEVVGFLKGEIQLRTQKVNLEKIRRKQEQQKYPDFADVRGQELLRRAAEIAVSGFHNLLVIGPPGAGKSMIAKRIPSILPRPSKEELLEITRIHSAAGTLPEEGVITVRPFRSPHHTASQAALAGGGRSPRPGEVTLSHRGVLFLDELPEFSQTALEILRQPMEDGQITISRAAGSCTFPARFILVGACNPCKCGYWPDRTRCRCNAREVKKYMEHISQPLLDRMDLCVRVEELGFEELTGDGGESSAQIRKRVEQAFAVQRARYRKSAYTFNADLPLKAAEEYCALGKAEEEMLKDIYVHMDLTGRSVLKVLRVARTIADLAGSEKVTEQHLKEASLYRIPDRRYWGGEV